MVRVVPSSWHNSGPGDNKRERNLIANWQLPSKQHTTQGQGPPYGAKRRWHMTRWQEVICLHRLFTTNNSVSFSHLASNIMMKPAFSVLVPPVDILSARWFSQRLRPPRCHDRSHLYLFLRTRRKTPSTFVAGDWTIRFST